MRYILAVVLLVTTMFAQSTVETSQVIDKKFVVLASVNMMGSILDARTTVISRDQRSYCVEGNSWLYGRYPTASRVYPQMIASAVAFTYASYFLRRHNSRLWSLPLLWDAGNHWHGYASNIGSCQPRWTVK